MSNSTVHNHTNRRIVFARVPALLVAACFLSVAVFGQDFNRSFRVTPDASAIDVIIKAGSVSIVPGDNNLIQISARRSEASISAVQAPQQGTVKVEVTDNAPVDLIVSVPVETALSLLCVKCGVTIKGLRGTIRVSTTEGDILLTGIRSKLVEARSMSGNVSYSGEVAITGRYSLKSFSGRVEAYLPAGSKFKLDATSARGGIEFEPNDFQLIVEKQTSQFVHGFVGGAGATLALWTQEGSIRVKKR